MFTEFNTEVNEASSIALQPFSRVKSNKTPEISGAIFRYRALGYQMTSGVVKYGYKESEPGNCTVIRARLVGLENGKLIKTGLQHG